MWDSYGDEHYFNRGYAELIMYFSRHNELDIADGYECADGFLLGKWIKEVRKQWENDELSQEQIHKLQTIGLGIDEKEQKWETMLRYTKAYISETGNDRLQPDVINDDGVLIGAWLDRQKRICESSCNIAFDKRIRIEKLGV